AGRRDQPRPGLLFDREGRLRRRQPGRAGPPRPAVVQRTPPSRDGTNPSRSFFLGRNSPSRFQEEEVMKRHLSGVAAATAAVVGCWLSGGVTTRRVSADPPAETALDRQLAGMLKGEGFTGRMQEQLEKRLGRKLDAGRAHLGRLLWFDRLLGIKLDN